LVPVALFLVPPAFFLLALPVFLVPVFFLLALAFLVFLGAAFFGVAGADAAAALSELDDEAAALVFLARGLVAFLVLVLFLVAEPVFLVSDDFLLLLFFPVSIEVDLLGFTRKDCLF